MTGSLKINIYNKTQILFNLVEMFIFIIYGSVTYIKLYF